LLQKSFWGDERKFSEPLMRPAPRDVRDHIISYKNDHVHLTYEPAGFIYAIDVPLASLTSPVA
jgi:hypothetical protein